MEDFDVLLNPSRLRCGETHDEFEKLLAVRVALQHGKRFESLQVTAYPVLLVHGELCSH